jgi:hypothetical protein
VRAAAAAAQREAAATPARGESSLRAAPADDARLAAIVPPRDPVRAALHRLVLKGGAS